MHMSLRARQWGLTLLVSFLSGLVITLLTLALLSTKNAGYLPGGSFFVGGAIGSALMGKFHLRPAPFVIVVCAIAGVLGWAIILPFI